MTSGPPARSARLGVAKPRSPVEGNGVAGHGLDLETLRSVLRDVRMGNYSARVPLQGSRQTRAVIDEVNALIQDAQRSHEELVRSAASAARIAFVLEAVASGDLSQTMETGGEQRPLQEPFLRTARTVNAMVRQLRTFTSEVSRVAEEVGTHGRLGGQARVRGAAGVWRELTDNVNYMASNLTAQVRAIAEVTTAVAKGDLSKKVTVDVSGEILELKNTINTMVDQLNAFAGEVTRVAREVGTEGKLGGQAQVPGVSGTWADLTDNVNLMAANLTAQVRNIAEVTTAVARGDLSRKITVDVRGEIRELKETINVMVDQLNAFASEVTRVAREVGTEGRLGGQAEVKDLAGVWRDLTHNVNQLAANLTTQVRNIAEVTTAVAKGDLSKKITVSAQGEILELKDTINVMVDQLNALASEVTRVAREVGTEGKLGGQAYVVGVAGTWKDLTDNVNLMAGNLTAQVRNIAAVTTAVARGDLSRKITVDVQGEIRELKDTVNTMVDQLNAFGSEVTRVAREVGTEGKLGGQAEVKGVGGVWKDLTENVNFMAGNLTAQVRNIAEVTTAVAKGDLSKKITADVHGEMLELKSTINGMVDQLNAFAGEVTRVAREVGTEGRLGGQAYVAGVSGTWADLTDNVNQLAANLTTQVRNIAEVTTAVAKGDLSKKITVEVRGEILELKDTINTMVDQLNAFASEVTRVAREVGSEGKLGGQANVEGVAGTWKDLTDNVNMMAGNLTDQVRGIARVVTAVAHGDLNKKLVLEAKGEIAALADTINEMTDTLARFADQVTTVAREVGSEGKLGGQAVVPGAAGTWGDLTENVNRLAANLTTQVRAIAEVATAVTEGDLTRSIGVEAQGELALLKTKINEMIRRLRVTTQKNMEQDWLKTNLANHMRMLQGQRDLTIAATTILSELAPLVDAQHGTLYMKEVTADRQEMLRLRASYASGSDLPLEFRLGEGLIGQCAAGKRRIVLSDLPADSIRIRAGLAEITPADLVLLPILFEDEVKAVIELASVRHFSRVHLDFLDQLTEGIGIVFSTIEANMRTEELLKQSQILFAEAQEASRSKSAFLSMAAHELRTPLSVITGYLSMLQDGTLKGEAAERPIAMLMAKARELNGIVNDLLMAARIEGGTVPTQLVLLNLADAVQEALRRAEPRIHLLNAMVSVETPSHPVIVQADREQLGRILDNLINNALTYTSARPDLSIEVSGEPVPEVAVIDRGVGIPPEMRERVFERFFRIDHPELGPQPGTGLGLFISRELAQRLGGSLALDWSDVGKGSRFVLRLPVPVDLSATTPLDRLLVKTATA